MTITNMTNGRQTVNIEWANPELLQDADTWAAYENATVLWSQLSRTPSTEGIEAMCRDAISFLDSGKAPNYVVDRWRPAYARVITALGVRS